MGDRVGKKTSRNIGRRENEKGEKKTKAATSNKKKKKKTRDSLLYDAKVSWKLEKAHVHTHIHNYATHSIWHWIDDDHNHDDDSVYFASTLWNAIAMSCKTGKKAQDVVRSDFVRINSNENKTTCCFNMAFRSSTTIFFKCSRKDC